MPTDTDTLAQLDCGCILRRVETSDDWTRQPCPLHTPRGACRPCLDGTPHDVCPECGLGDDRHGSVCRMSRLN